MLLEIVLVLLVVKVLQILWNRRHLYYTSWKLDGPVAWPLIGNILYLVSKNDTFFDKLYEMTKKYKMPSRFWVGPYMLVQLADPEDLQIVMAKALKKPFAYQYANDWVGEKGLITSEISDWEQHRRVIAPTFNWKVLEGYMATLDKKAKILVHELRPFSESKQYLDVFDVLCKCTLDMIMETVLGVKYNGQGQGPDSKEADAYIKATKLSFSIFYDRTIKIWYKLELVYKTSQMFQDFKNCCTIFHGLSDRILTQKKVETANQSTAEKKSFMGALMQQSHSQAWDDAEIRAEIDSMIAAGADTTAHSLSFILVLLATHQDIQSRVFNEIEEVISLMEVKKQKFLSRELLEKLTYMDQVIKESLRLFTPSPITGRTVTEPIQLKSVDIILPAGTIVLLGNHHVHHDPLIWGEDVAAFNPDRFKKDQHTKRHAYSYIPFSAGPRNCIGLRFARISMKTILFHILKNYRLDTDEKFSDIKCDFHLLLEKVGGWKVQFLSR